MISKRSKWRKGPAPLAATVLLAGLASGCASNPMAFGKVDRSSPVAADVVAAQHAPGPYPNFAEIPPAPKDVRPVSAWRAAVYDEWGLKKQTEAEAAAIPFVLTVGDAEGWAAVERAKIPAAEMIPPASDASSQAEAFAQAGLARATPPPTPK